MIARNLTLDHLSNRGTPLQPLVTVSYVPEAGAPARAERTFNFTQDGKKLTFGSVRWFRRLSGFSAAGAVLDRRSIQLKRIQTQ